MKNPEKKYCSTVILYGEKKNVEKVCWTFVRDFYAEKFKSLILPVIKIEGNDNFYYFIDRMIPDNLPESVKYRIFANEKELWEYIISNGWICGSNRPHSYFRKEYRTKISKEWVDVWEDYEDAVKYMEKYENELKEYCSWSEFEQEMFDSKIEKKHFDQCREIWNREETSKGFQFFMNWRNRVIYNTKDDGIWYDIYTDEIVRKPVQQTWVCKKCGTEFNSENYGKATYGANHKVYHYCKNCAGDMKK